MKIIEKRPLLIILLLYSLANFLMSFNNGVFWDDWCIYKMSFNGISQISKGVGLIQMLYINYFLQNLTNNPPLIYHFLIFIFELVSIVLFYKICSNYINNRTILFTLTLFFALIPYNEAKILMCCFQYNLGFLLFLTGCFLFTKRSVLIYRIVSSIFFFVSFSFLNSNLILILGFIFFISLYESDKSFSIICWLKKIPTYTDFIFLPFLFWLFRSYYMRPTGIYRQQGYNTASLDAFKHLPINLLYTIKASSFGLLSELIHSINYSYILLLAFSAFILILVTLFSNIKYPLFIRNYSSKWFFVSIFFFISGAFAYIAVDKVPSFSGYENRHQILLKIGAAIFLTWFVMIFKYQKLQRITMSIILSSFIVITTFHNLNYLSSWMKQMSLEENFKNSALIRDNKTFIVTDNTLTLNETEREYLSYCYNGISKKAFGNQLRFFIPQSEINNYRDFLSLYTNNEYYNCKDYILKKDDLKFEIKINNNASRPAIFSLLYSYYFSKSHFNDKIKNYITLTIVPKSS
jgi:hypothetical protein